MRHPKFESSFRGFQKILQKIKLPSRAIFIVMGILSTLWFFARVIPKPQRAGYPCMQAAFPIMTGFMIWVLSVTGSIAAFRYARKSLKAQKYLVGLTLLIAAMAFGTYSFVHFQKEAKAADNYVDNNFFTANEPVGTSQGIHPGRVVWVHNPDATDETCVNTLQDPYFSPDNNDQAVIDEMFDESILKLTGELDLTKAWDAIFKNFNLKKGKGSIDYKAGELVFVKVNQGTAGWNSQSDMSRKNNTRPPDAETSPFTMMSLLRHLVEEAGVPQQNIMIGDPIAHLWKETYDYLYAEFPNIQYMDKQDKTEYGRITMDITEDPVIIYSDKGTIMPGAVTDHIYVPMDEADYLINIGALKAHARAGITLTAKNHFGSHSRDGASHLHPSLVAPENDVPLGTTVGYNKYRVFVDIMGHEKLGQNTLLYFIDGLWGGREATEPPRKFTSAPFNNDWSSSLIVSLDQVALESVCFDILRTEYNDPTDLKNYRPHLFGADDYLQQAADRSFWPEGILYDPEDDGYILKSLGIHEHWNNSVDRQYSRNLGRDYGIELITIPSDLAATTPFAAREATVPPVIDGDVTDECWASADWYYIDQTWMPYGTSIPKADFTGKFKVMWSQSENLLYYLVKVTDDVFVDDYIYPATGYPDFDIVEVFIDEDKSGGQHIFDVIVTGENAENAFSYHLAANAPADGEVTTTVVAADIAGTSWGNRITPNYADHFPEFALKKIGNDYYYEFSMKVFSSAYDPLDQEASRVTLTTDKVMGMSVAYCDNDTPETTRDNFFGSVWVRADRFNSHWENSDDYGELHLLPSSAPINHRPELIADLPVVILDESGTEATIIADLSQYFVDDDGDDLLYEVFFDDEEISYIITGNALTVTTTADFGGLNNVVIKATDAGNLSATGSFVIQGINRAPIVSQTISDYYIEFLGTDYTVVANLNTVFSDPDNDDLEFTASSESPDVSVSITGNALIVRGNTGFTDETTITVIADDGQSQVEVTFTLIYTTISVELNSLEASLLCYPNPITDGWMQVIFSDVSAGQVDIRVFNTRGQLNGSFTFNKHNGEFNQRINLDHLENGFYLLEVRFNDMKTVYRFTK